MKHCNKCNTTKPLTSFHRRKNSHQPWCIPCRKTHDHGTFKSKPQRRQSLKESTAKYREAAETLVANHLKANPCVKCGESHILTLQFDHLRDKKLEISTAVQRGWSLSSIKEEMNKCQVLCANCHSIKTANDNNSWKLKWLADSDSNRDPTP